MKGFLCFTITPSVSRTQGAGAAQGQCYSTPSCRATGKLLWPKGTGDTTGAQGGALDPSAAHSGKWEIRPLVLGMGAAGCAETLPVNGFLKDGLGPVSGNVGASLEGTSATTTRKS